jgi:hypothetical protein
MSTTITLGFVGDVCLYGLGESLPKPIDENLVFAKKLNQTVDVSIANLEFVIVPDGYLNKKSMAVPVSKLPLLEKSDFNIYCLANNHIMDHGSEMLTFTQSYLDEKGIQYVGAGSNRAKSGKILYINKKGINIGIINATDATHYKSTKMKAGVNPYKKSSVLKDIKEAKQSADLVIVCIHSDYEFSNIPAPWKVKASRQFIDYGADFVIHHHPHTLQGLERWGRGLIAYSLGNFIFPVYGNSYMESHGGDVHESCYLKAAITIKNDESKYIDYEIIPTQIASNNITTEASKVEADQIQEKIFQYSEELKNIGHLQAQYYVLCKSKLRGYFFGIYYELRKKGISSGFKYFAHHLRSKMHRHMFLGFITKGRC